MNKRGFTLIELLGVVTMIVLISILVIPNIASNVNSKKNEINEANLKILGSAVDVYIERNSNLYANTFEADGSTYCIPFQTLVNEGLLLENFSDSNGIVDSSSIIKATYQVDYNSFDYELVSNSECSEVINYISRPNLLSNMIPVYYENGAWKKADVDTHWYNYASKKWANAVIVREWKSGTTGSKSRYQYKSALPGTTIFESDILAYFVWIPRFRYQLFDSNSAVSINVVFEGAFTPKSSGTNEGEWFTHPAFTYKNQELSGIWVGKYEASLDSSDIVIKSGGTPLTYSGSDVIEPMGNYNNIYGFDVSPHIIRNSEWAAVSYLSNSKYGINSSIAASNSSTTGSSVSTTNNETGVYDMSGVTKEMVILGDETVNSLGFALVETTNWYSDTNAFVANGRNYLSRGGTSIFNYVNNDSDPLAFRVVVSK